MFGLSCCSLCPVATAILLSVGAPQGEPAGQDAPRPTSAPVAATQPTTATQAVAACAVALSAEVYPQGVSDEAQYDQHNRRRTSALLAAAERAGDPLAETEHRLAVANWILARQAEPQISRLLLDIELPGDQAALQSSVAQALAQLEVCRALLDSQPEQSEPDSTDTEHAGRQDAAAKSARRLGAVHSDLATFAEALALAWSADRGEDFVARARRSASSLGVLLEDDRPGVAAAAAVYQAVLYSRTDQLDRSLAVLDLALAPLPAGATSVAFFGRLLRCHYLAQQGAYATAWSLLLRLEERARDWFTAPDPRAEAVRALGVVRLEVAQAWGQALDRQGKADEAAWCRRAADQIRRSLGQEPQPPLAMRLGRSLPFLLDDYDFHAKTEAAE